MTLVSETFLFCLVGYEFRPVDECVPKDSLLESAANKEEVELTEGGEESGMKRRLGE